MGKIKVIRVVFSILLVQLFTLSVNADEKADYLKLAQRCGKKFGAVRLLTFKTNGSRQIQECFGRHTILLSGVEHGLLS